MSTKQTEQTPIAVDEVLSKSEAFVLKNKSTIIGAVAAIVILIAGSIIYHNYVAIPAEKEAAEALFPAQALFEAGSYQEALDGDGTNLGFIAIADEYSSTTSGNIANAYAGLSLAQLGKYEEAIPYLKSFDGDDQLVAPAVIGALGNCYAQIGDNSAAVKSFTNAASMANNNTISAYYLMQAAAIYEQEGKNAKALDLYEDIKKKYPTAIKSEQFQQGIDIEKYINRVK